jgi:hypothetical protein
MYKNICTVSERKKREREEKIITLKINHVPCIHLCNIKNPGFFSFYFQYNHVKLLWNFCSLLFSESKALTTAKTKKKEHTNIFLA